MTALQHVGLELALDSPSRVRVRIRVGVGVRTMHWLFTRDLLPQQNLGEQGRRERAGMGLTKAAAAATATVTAGPLI
jgi:hypothetical protein